MRRIVIMLALVMLSNGVTQAGLDTAPNGTNCKTGDDKPSLFRLASGGGLSWLMDDHEDFKVVNYHVYVDNDSRTRPNFLTGTLFRFWQSCAKVHRNLNLSINLELTQGDTNAVGGVFFGVGWQVHPAIVLVAGYSRHPGKELSPGYKRAIGQYLQTDAGRMKYEDIKLSHGMIADRKYYAMTASKRKGDSHPFSASSRAHGHGSHRPSGPQRSGLVPEPQDQKVELNRPLEPKEERPRPRCRIRR